jgi:eukaryotic-like serine/threonine-protein kinase
MANESVRPGMLAPGTVFHDRYRVERCLKCGGMGAVSEITDLNTERRRALKTMLPDSVSDPGLRARFKHEATITAQVESEHLVEIFDAGIDAATGMPFIVMELLKGEDLGELLAHTTRLAPAEVMVLLHQASGALDRTHALGIVHRDLKPENLFVTRRDDGTPRLRILDFGIAKLLTHSTRWRTTGVIGTPLYMSPEQALGEPGIGPPTDLYALGHIAFTLLVGEAFWEQAARALSAVVLLGKVSQGATETATERAADYGVTLPPGFDAWFAKATARVPRDRFETASELVEALAQVLGVPLPSDATRQLSSADTLASGPPRFLEQPSQSTCGPVSRDRPHTTPRRPVVLIVVGLFALAAVGLVGALLLPRRASDPIAAASGEASASAMAPPSESSVLGAAPVVRPAEPAPSMAADQARESSPAPKPPLLRASPAGRSTAARPVASPKAPGPPAMPSRRTDPSDLY